jgi:hypothetical protein
MLAVFVLPKEGLVRSETTLGHFIGVALRFMIGNEEIMSWTTQCI